jgi:hypothetical protein
VGLRVGVCDTNIQNAVGASCPESSDEQVTSFLFSGGGFFVEILSGEVFTFSVAQPWMRGSSRTAEGVKALLAKFTSSLLRCRLDLIPRAFWIVLRAFCFHPNVQATCNNGWRHALLIV